MELRGAWATESRDYLEDDTMSITERMLFNTDVNMFHNVKCIFPVWKRKEARLYYSELQWTLNIQRHKLQLRTITLN